MVFLIIHSIVFLDKFSDFFGAFIILVVLWIDVNFYRSTIRHNDERYSPDCGILIVFHLGVMLWCYFFVKMLTSRQQPFVHDACNFLLLLFFVVSIATLIGMLLQQICGELVYVAIAER